jgi:protein-disulfide isomerase
MSTEAKQPKREARERLVAERAAQEAAKRRKDNLVRGGLAALVIVLVAAVGLVFILTHKSTVVTGSAAPAGANATHGFATGSASKPVVDIYEDFQCPICKQYESNLGQHIEGLATSGKASVVYHMLTFLDRSDTGAADTLKSSTRAANAGACAQNQGKFLAFHDVVYANQPTEGVGYTDAQLIAFGQKAGVPDMAVFTTCVKNQTYLGFLSLVSSEADARQVSGTPTFFVDGKMLNFNSATSFVQVQQILDAAVSAAA